MSKLKRLASIALAGAESESRQSIADRRRSGAGSKAPDAEVNDSRRSSLAGAVSATPTSDTVDSRRGSLVRRGTDAPPTQSRLGRRRSVEVKEGDPRSRFQRLGSLAGIRHMTVRESVKEQEDVRSDASRKSNAIMKTWGVAVKTGMGANRALGLRASAKQVVKQATASKKVKGKLTSTVSAFKKWSLATKDDSIESRDNSSQMEVWMSRVTYLRGCQAQNVAAETKILDFLGAKRIKISGKGMTADGIKPLTMALMNNTFVRDLDVGDNNLGGEGTRFICEMLHKNYSVERLNISKNNVCSDDGSIALEDMLKTNMGLLDLNLSKNNIGDRDGKHIAEGLTNNRTLERLILSHNALTATAAQAFGHSLSKNKWLIELRLDSNNLKSRGVVAICNAMLHSSHLQTLTLSDNDFGYDGAVALSRLIRFNKRLTKLEISKNRIAWEGLMLMGKALAINSTLEELKMASNPVTAQGVIDLLNAIFSNTNSALKALDLSEIKVTPKCLELAANIAARKKKFIFEHGGLLNNENIFQRKRDYATAQQQKWASHLDEEKLRISDLFKSIERYNFVKACEEHAAMMAEMEDEEDDLTYGDGLASASQISGMLSHLKRPQKGSQDKKPKPSGDGGAGSGGGEGATRSSNGDGDLPHLSSGGNGGEGSGLFQENRETYKKWENVRLPKLQTAAAIREEEEHTPTAIDYRALSPQEIAPETNVSSMGDPQAAATVTATSDRSPDGEDSPREIKSASAGKPSSAGAEKQRKTKGVRGPKSGKRA